MRKFHSLLAALALALCLAAPLAAQTPAKPDAAAEAAAAMERAKRQAAGPMRFILEASKARRKPGEGDAPPAVASAAAAAPLEAMGLRSVASRAPLPAAAASPPSNLSAVLAPPSRVAAQAASAPTAAGPAGTAAPSRASSDAVTTQVTLEAGSLRGKPTTTAVSGLESSSVMELMVAPLAVAPKLGSSQMRATDRVRLLSIVEPELPQRVLDEMGRNAAIRVDLHLGTDGSVTSVELASSAPRGLLRMLSPALEQWKFAPLTAPQTHRIELLFNVER